MMAQASNMIFPPTHSRTSCLFLFSLFFLFPRSCSRPFFIKSIVMWSKNISIFTKKKREKKTLTIYKHTDRITFFYSFLLYFSHACHFVSQACIWWDILSFVTFLFPLFIFYHVFHFILSFFSFLFHVQIERNPQTKTSLIVYWFLSEWYLEHIEQRYKFTYSYRGKTIFRSWGDRFFERFTYFNSKCVANSIWSNHWNLLLV